MRRTTRRTGTVVTAAAGVLLLLAGPASAHFCTNIQRADVANAALAKGSKGWFVLSRDLGMFVPGMCQEGLDHLIAAFESTGADADMPILANSVLALGVQRQIFETRTKTALPKPIADTDFAAFDALDDAVPTALELCAS